MEMPLSEAEVKSAQGRFVRLLLGLLAAYLLLIMVHNDDFWPFSRFPMFSAAGRSWTRGLLRELTPAELAQPLLEVEGDQLLPGRPLALHSLAKNQDDLTQLVRRVDSGMSPQDQQFLADYLRDARKSRHMVLYLVRGSFRARRAVRVRFRPVAVIGPEGVRAIPKEATQPLTASDAGAAPEAGASGP
jgi:hypothetical protein